MLRAPLITFATVVLAALSSSCSDSNSESLACGASDKSTSLIKGPSVGSSGNNSDNPFRALAVHPSDPATLYVGSEGNGIFKSTDGGANWTWLRSGIYHCDAYPEIYSIAIDPSDPSRMLMAANSGPGSPTSGHSSTAGVYKSTDAGNTWTQLNGGLSNSDTNFVHIVSGSHFLVGLGAGNSTNSGSTTFFTGGIFYTGISGTSWTQSTAPAAAAQSLFWQVVARASGMLAFGGNPTSGGGSGASGILKSTDSGLTWSALTQPLAGLDGAHIEASSDLQTIYANLRSGASSPTFYKSTNGGTSWTSPVGFTGPIRIIGGAATTALAGDGHQIFRTTDGFATTSTVLTAANGSNTIMAIESAPSNSSVVYATTKGLLVYRSTDGGLNFSLRSSIRTFIDSQ